MGNISESEKGKKKMPTYEYECINCGHRFEIFQSITAAHLKECPKCRGRIDRLISQGIGIIFKGPGFYQTDYKNKRKEKSCPIDKDNPPCESCNLNKKNNG